MSEKTDQISHSVDDLGTFQETACSHLKCSWSATPAQRLLWLEEALTLAYQAGAIPLRTLSGEKRQ